jgi:hypothetical protein
MGVLITMAEPTRGVRDAVNHGGTYMFPVNGQTFPRVQVITVAQLLRGERPKCPPRSSRTSLHRDVRSRLTS